MSAVPPKLSPFGSSFTAGGRVPRREARAGDYPRGLLQEKGDKNTGKGGMPALKAEASQEKTGLEAAGGSHIPKRV